MSKSDLVTLALGKSGVLPSVAADRRSVFVVTDKNLTMYSHNGTQKFQSNSTVGKMLTWKGRVIKPLGNNPYADVAADHSRRGRTGGQVTLQLNTSSGIAINAYFSTFQGHLLRFDVKTKQVQVLIQITDRYMRGLALQTYTIPGRSQLAKRLYVTAASKYLGDTNGKTRAGDTTIVRLNLDHLEKLVSKNKKAAPKSKWKSLTKEVVKVTNPEYSFSRLAYATGKLYYMSASPSERYVLTSTDVTVAVGCDEVMSLVGPEFQKWPVSTHGKAYEATPDKPEFVDLHETSKITPRMPWEFRAYRKTLQIGNKVIFKHMVCSRPKQPTTRPTQEQCCVRKYFENATDPDPGSSCSLTRAVKQM